MKIGIMADSHENMPKIAKAVEVFNKEGVSVVFHAGDIISAITEKEFKKLIPKFIGVFGNNDAEEQLLRHAFSRFGGELHNTCYVGCVENKKIVMFHEPILIDELSKSSEVDIIIYGHTHKVDTRKVNNVLIINPGECGGWIYNKSTIVILDLTTMEPQVVEL
jgi:putative phosphoesterase